MAAFDVNIYVGTKRATHLDALTDVKNHLNTHVDAGSGAVFVNVQVTEIGPGKYYQGGVIYG